MINIINKGYKERKYKNKNDTFLSEVMKTVRDHKINGTDLKYVQNICVKHKYGVSFNRKIFVDMTKWKMCKHNCVNIMV